MDFSIEDRSSTNEVEGINTKIIECPNQPTTRRMHTFQEHLLCLGVMQAVARAGQALMTSGCVREGTDGSDWPDQMTAKLILT